MFHMGALPNDGQRIRSVRYVTSAFGIHSRPEAVETEHFRINISTTDNHPKMKHQPSDQILTTIEGIDLLEFRFQTAFGTFGQRIDLSYPT